MRLAQPSNEKVLASLSRRGAGASEISRPDAVPNAYLNCGCHPDIVERLWDQLGQSLPQDCRFLIFNTPALAHPDNGLILAVGIGTQYGLRTHGMSAEEAQHAGSRTLSTFNDSGAMNIRQDYGADWVFGCWLPIEALWCRAVYDACQSES